MEYRTFCKNQREVAICINEVIDAYWEDKFSEEMLIDTIDKLYCNNIDKIFKDGEFTKILQ